MEKPPAEITFSNPWKKIKRSDAVSPTPIPAKKDEFNEGQMRVLDAVHAGKSVFFSGPAGSGKSQVMRECIDRSKASHGAHLVGVTASTGIAAINISGRTLHSFTGIGIGAPDLKALIRKVKRNSVALRNWKEVDVLFVDEISMIDAEMFDQLEALARKLRITDEPFGGIQLVLCGDFFQLPPVEAHPTIKKDFCFQAKSWDRVIKETVMLREVFRQSADAEFLAILEEMRWGRLSLASTSRLFDYSGLHVPEDLARTKLYSRNFEVQGENARRLKKLPGEPEVFNAYDQGLPDQRLQLNKMCRAEETIKLKLGARVILLWNMDQENHLVNGSQGEVIKFVEKESEYEGEGEGEDVLDSRKRKAEEEEKWLSPPKAMPKRIPLVKFDNGLIRFIRPKEWTIENRGKILARRIQIPLTLSYALSIHKSQGMTIDNLEVDLGNCFACGQAYVALSRGTSLGAQKLDGIDARTVVRNFDPLRVKADPRVVAYYEKFD